MLTFKLIRNVPTVSVFYTVFVSTFAYFSQFLHQHEMTGGLRLLQNTL